MKKSQPHSSNSNAAPIISAENRVLDLNGQGSYVQLPDGVFDPLDEATIELWAMWHHFRYYSQPIGFGPALGNTRHQITITSDEFTNTLRFGCYEEEKPPNKRHDIYAPDALQGGRWYHIVAVTGPGGMKLLGLTHPVRSRAIHCAF